MSHPYYPTWPFFFQVRHPGPAGFASTATGLAVPVLETGKGGGKAGAGDTRIDNPPLLG
jgi:hypothetical protein